MAKKTTALVRYDEELAKMAEAAAAQEANTGGGQFFSVRGGTLALNGAPIPGNQMGVVIVDSVLENVLYEGDFDPENPTNPVCFAFGRDEKVMAPHAECESPQSEGCADCPHNQWGSSAKGRGKACRNRRRLALIPAGTFDPKTEEFTAFTDPDELVKQPVAYFNLPPTSINGFGAYVKQLAGTVKRPPQAVYTKISVVPDTKTQLKVVFELLDLAPDEVLGALLERHKEQRAVIEFPYAKNEVAEAKKPAKAAKKATPVIKKRY